MIACFLSNISVKDYKNPSMLSRVTAKNVGDVFFETQCIFARSVSAVTTSKKVQLTLIGSRLRAFQRAYHG